GGVEAEGPGGGRGAGAEPDRAAGPEQCLLHRVIQTQAHLPARTKVPPDHLGSMPQAEDRPPDAPALKGGQYILEEGTACDGNHGLGKSAGNGLESRADSPGKNDGGYLADTAHYACSGLPSAANSARSTSSQMMWPMAM